MTIDHGFRLRVAFGHLAPPPPCPIPHPVGQYDEYVKELQSKVNAAQNAADNAKDDLENLKAELDEKTEQFQAFRKKEVRAVHNIYFPDINITFRWRYSKN